MENYYSQIIKKRNEQSKIIEECRTDMEMIALQIFNSEKERLMAEIKEMIYQAQYQAYSDALRDVLGVLEYDIESVTRIGFDGCKDIFEDKKAQKFISDHIMKTIIKELKNKNFRR